MIKHIKLQGIATYTEPVDIDFKDINFIYGGNGTGKKLLYSIKTFCYQSVLLGKLIVILGVL